MSTIPKHADSIAARSNADSSFARLDLTRFTKEVVGSLSKCGESEILRVRNNSKLLGTVAWKIEVACDAELFNRTKAKNGRGNKDIDGNGIMAAVARRAKEIGCTPNTIWSNWQIARLVQEVENVISENNVLEDKGFYKAALTAVNPLEAIKLFVSKKLNNDKFKVSEAYRLLDTLQLTKLAAKTQAIEGARQVDTQSLLDHIERTKARVIDEIIPDCPDTNFADRVYGALVDDLDDQIADLDTSDLAETLRKAWDAGYRTTEQISKYAGCPDDEVTRVMLTLCDDGDFLQTGQGRGRTQLWHKIGEPFGSALHVVRTTTAYDSED